MNRIKIFRVWMITAIGSVMLGCDSFFDVGVDKSIITSDVVFSNDITATAAMTGVYHDMLNVASFASGSNQSVSSLAALSSDEFKSYSADQDFISINQNVVRDDNQYVRALWASLYNTIYGANSLINGLSKANGVTDTVKLQLEAEAKFVRGFCHFYLVNLFGDVPLIISVDYRKNSQAPKSSSSDVYAQIVEDLRFAEDNLLAAYTTEERVRPNKCAAKALLARVYLYSGDWSSAESKASDVINDFRYTLVDLADVFIANSQEAIWQLKPVEPYINTQDGYFSILMESPVNNYVSSNVIADGFMTFDDDDQRKDQWISSYSDGENTWFFPFKYKIKYGGDPLMEYSTVLRLGEVYLIRAESRAHQSDIEGAVHDVDSIRVRAGLSPVDDSDGLDREELLSLIYNERKLELFCEWGHRWLDLKRTGRADEILNGIKAGWTAGSQFYPIPRIEIENNPALR